jgi:hypothetical protein
MDDIAKRKGEWEASLDSLVRLQSVVLSVVHSILNRKEEMTVEEKQVEINKEEEKVTPQVALYCLPHTSCCATQGCPGLFKENLRDKYNPLWTGECCY